MSQVVISLTDGGGVMGERIEYICAPADENALVGQTGDSDADRLLFQGRGTYADR